MKESLGLYGCYFGIYFSFLSHEFLYYRVLLLEKPSEGLGCSHVENDFLVVSSASFLQLDYLIFENFDFFAKLIDTFGILLFRFILFVGLLDCRESLAVVFDDSIDLYIFFIELFLEVNILVAVFLIFVNNFLGMVKIIFEFFILFFELLDSIKKLLIV